MPQKKSTKKTGSSLKHRTIGISVIVLGVLVAGLLGSMAYLKISANFANAATCTAYTYQQGGNGTCVKYIQQIVNASGTSGSITADGSFGPLTKTAVVKFQQNRGITADGIVGPNTWKKLCAVTQAAAASPKSAAGCSGSGSASGWTRVFNNGSLNISACNAGTYAKLRFELGPNKTSISSVMIGSTVIKTSLSTSRTSVVGNVQFGNSTPSVYVYPAGKDWVRLGSFNIVRANYASC